MANIDGQCDPSEPRPVTWTTILYALITFGLNTMLQPAGMVCGTPPALGFMLRSSPIISVIDTGFLLCRLAYYYLTSNSRNPREDAHTRLLRLRYQSWSDGDMDKVDTIANVQQSQPIRLLVFVFTLPQMIRLYSASGVYWSKAIASMYLLSFVFMEILVVWPRARKPGVANNITGEKMIKSSGSLSLSYVSVAQAVGFMSWFAASALGDILDQPHTALPKYIGVVVFAYWALAIIFLYIMNAIDRKSWKDIPGPTLLCLALGIPIVYYTLGTRMIANIDNTLLVQAITAGLAIAWTMVCLVYASNVTSTIRHAAKQDDRNQVARHKRYIEKILAWYFMLLHLVTAVLYLCFSYISTGTSLPEWSDYLN